MSNLLNALRPAERIDLLISQWQREGGRLKGLASDLLQLAEDELAVPLRRLEEMTDLDKAFGVWLDYIGERAGLRRPVQEGNSTWFGFAPEDTGFNQAPFYTRDVNIRGVNAVPDATYRTLLKLAGAGLTYDGTLGHAERIICDALAPGQTCFMRDNHDMTASLHFVGVTEDVQDIYFASELLPRPAGVQLLRDDRVSGDIFETRVIGDRFANYAGLSIESIDQLLSDSMVEGPASFEYNSTQYVLSELFIFTSGGQTRLCLNDPIARYILTEPGAYFILSNEDQSLSFNPDRSFGTTSFGGVLVRQYTVYDSEINALFEILSGMFTVRIGVPLDG